MSVLLFVIAVASVAISGCTADPVSIGGGDPKTWETLPGEPVPIPQDSPLQTPLAATAATEPVREPQWLGVDEDDEDLRPPHAMQVPVSKAVTICRGVGEGKRIVIVLSEQKLYACENNRPVFETSVSTGRTATPTPVGEYRIYLKLVADDMAGPGYYLPAVPYTMYFYRGYAIHGAYWHNNFGHVMSHGCVNLPTVECPRGWTCPAQEAYADKGDIAKEVFYWAEPILPDGAGVVQASKDNPGTIVIVRP